MIHVSWVWSSISSVVSDGSQAAAILDNHYGVLQKIILIAAVVLAVSAVLTAMFERKERSSFGWWLMWLSRTAGIAGMVFVAAEFDGVVSEHLESVKTEFGEPTEIGPPRESPPLVLQGNTLVSHESKPENKAQEIIDTEWMDAERLASLAGLRRSFADALFWQLVFGSLVLLVSAFKEAGWRKQWVERKKHYLEVTKEIEKLRLDSEYSPPVVGDQEDSQV